MLLRVFATGVVLLLLVASGEGQNYALYQPAYQYGIWRVALDNPSNAVDGSLNQDVPAGVCAHSGQQSTWMPWWVVKLSRWIRVTSVRVYGRNDDADPRSSNSTYNVGPFWNVTLPSVVPMGTVLSDPLASNRFSLLYRQPQPFYNYSSSVLDLNATTLATGLYFGVRSSQLENPVILCEVQVFGEVNRLLGSVSTLSVANSSPQNATSLSPLVDENPKTCLTFSVAQVDPVRIYVKLNSSLPKAIDVLASASVQPDGSLSSCSTADTLRVVMRRMVAGLPETSYACSYSQSQTDGLYGYHTFICACSDCVPEAIVWLQRGSQSTTSSVQLCELLVFNY